MPTSASRVTRRPTVDEVLLHNGDHLDQKTFHELYKRTPDGFKAELIGGIVYVASPTTFRHGRPHMRLALWLGFYNDETLGTDGLDNTTNMLAEDSEPQPDLCLRIEPEYGGQTRDDPDGYVIGPAELVAEVAYSTAAIDLHRKRNDYERAGVKEYVVALAREERVMWFVRGRRGFVELRPDADGVLRSKIFPGLWLEPAAVFARQPRRLLAALNKGLATPEHAAFVAKLEAKRAALARKKPKPTE